MNSYYSYTIDHLTIHQRINLKQQLTNQGVRFQFYSLAKVGATIGADGKCYIALPGIYNSVEQHCGDINDGSIRHCNR